jgi:hypothetical protein
MAAGEILRHSGAGAGILHRRPHVIPANETTVFLRVETLAHFTLRINLNDPASFLYVLFVLSTQNPGILVRPLPSRYITHDLLLQRLSHWVLVYSSRNGPGHGSNLALKSEPNASKPYGPKWTSKAVSNYRMDILSTSRHGTNAKQANTNHNTKHIEQTIPSQNYQQLLPHSTPIDPGHPSLEIPEVHPTTCSTERKQPSFRCPRP